MHQRIHMGRGVWSFIPLVEFVNTYFMLKFEANPQPDI